MFTTGSTPFGTFDADPQFQVEADAVVTYVTRKLGAPVLSVELSASHIYASLEESCLEYSAIINKYQALSVMAALLGSPTGTLSGQENRYPHNLFEFQKRMAEAATIEANLNGPYTLFSGTFVTVPNQQQYDLQFLLSGTALTGSNATARIELREIFHTSPLASYRFFGTTSAINYLHNQFSFESFTPETIFYLLPIWEDVLRGQQFKLSNSVRRSLYSYELHNNVLTLYPPPTDALPVYVKFYLPKGPYSSDFPDKTLDGVANLSNVPFGPITYSKLNSISRQWIRRFAFALAKETLGQIRGKFTTVPIPNGDLTLNGPELISDARAEQDALREELKAILEESTYDKVMAREAQKQEDLNRQMYAIPLRIYVGNFWPLIPLFVFLRAFAA